VADIKGYVLDGGVSSFGDGPVATPGLAGYVLSLSGAQVTDTTPPVITNFSPAADTQIEVNDPIQFDIADPSDNLDLFILHCSFSDGSIFVVHDGDNFTWPFLGISNARSNIAGGYRYTVLKDGGWFNGIDGVFDAPILHFPARDAAGNAGVIA
jgi:hypothetical protein